MHTFLKKILTIIFFIVMWPSSAHCQENHFRRHFIIAYDVSSPFVIAEKSTPTFRQALINLFTNKEVTQYDESDQNNLQIEKNNGVSFFDQGKDEISFFHFNVASSEFSDLRRAGNLSIAEIINSFDNIFLKNKEAYWSDFKRKDSSKIENFISSLFSIDRVPSNFGNGVSMSNFVYPLILNKISKDKYAEEYILIILSDFLSGSMMGNRQDFNRLKEAYGYSTSGTIPDNSAPEHIKSFVDDLSAKYYKIDFFDYSFPSNPKIAILSYKIKPKAGNLKPEDISIFVDADIDINQRGYKSQNFRISETRIKFTHNKSLKPNEVSLKISLPDSDSEIILFKDVIATRLGDNSWISDYTNNSKLLLFDSAKSLYYIPRLKVKLDSAIISKNVDYLKFTYEFKTNYSVENASPLNYIYTAERQLPKSSITFSTKATIIIMFYLLPILGILLLLIFLAFYGKPRGLSFRTNGYLDSFEKIDYKAVGKKITPFLPWNISKDPLIFNGEIEYRSSNFPLNWSSLVYLQLQDVSVPNGFELFLKQNAEDIKEFGIGNAMTIKKGKKNKLSFIVGIRQKDITQKVINPEPVKFKVETAIKDSILFIKSHLRETVEYNFHIGVDLRDVWVGFDPGTSGSCVAVGSATDNIMLAEDIRIKDIDNALRRIIPSVVGFDKEQNFKLNGTITESQFMYGNLAFFERMRERKYALHYSIKKLLGFKDIKKIVFQNGETLELKGKDLAGLLVRGLFKDVDSYFNRPGFNADNYKRDGQFNPLRAVVAIANNFTISKIQDMVDCIGNLNQFKEIRYVYEAEAVLFYYLSNFNQFDKDETALDSETILVFDMGGSTINATIVTANKILVNDRPIYDIDFLGKIGYGIGGDTIDYCITKFILSFSDEFPPLNGINIFERKIQLAELAFQVKKEIITNYYGDKDYLITANNLETFINKALGVTININDETSEMYKYFLKVSGRFKLFEHPLFIKTIYNNVKDAINEVVELSDSTHIDKVIFSGRSTSFPMIKETVEKQLKAKGGNTKSIAFNLEESKIAVAMGACWYGINKNSVRLNNHKTNAAFGFKRTLSANKTDVRFYELVEMGCTFDTRNDGIDSFEGSENISADFAFDGNKVNFYQVMGKDANKILSEGQKHKFSKIATINLDQVTSRVAMKVNENDEVECAVKLESNRVINEMGVVSDQEIDEANEEHYTWIVK